MKTVELIYSMRGHAAQQAMLDSPWRVRLVNLVEMIDPQALFHKTTGVQPEDVYNRRLSSGFTIGLTQELKVLQFLIRLGHNALTRKLRSYWIRTQPDLVVSLIPNFNRSLCQSVSSALPGVPLVTVLTDMADHPPSFWIEPDQPQHVVCGAEHAARQALAAGCAPQRIHRTSGMIIHPSFYATSTVNRVAERRAVGLDTDQAVGVVLFGGLGSMRQINCDQAARHTADSDVTQRWRTRFAQQKTQHHASLSNSRRMWLTGCALPISSSANRGRPV